MKRVEIKSELKAQGVAVSVSRITAIANSLGFSGPDYSDDEALEIMQKIAEPSDSEPGQRFRTDVRVDSSESERASSEIVLASKLRDMSGMLGDQFQQIENHLSMVEAHAGDRLAARIADVPSRVMVHAQRSLIERMEGSANIADAVLDSFSWDEIGGMALSNFTPAGALPASR